MFLVKHQLATGMACVFLLKDPRDGKFVGTVVEGVALDDNEENLSACPDGAAAPELCLGQDPADPKHFRRFKFADDLRKAGYRPVEGYVMLFDSWSKFQERFGLAPTTAA